MCDHKWIDCGEENEYSTKICSICGEFNREKIIIITETDNVTIEKCKHNWICLRDRCHNRGNGKYKAYKCDLCGKFQRR